MLRSTTRQLWGHETALALALALAAGAFLRQTWASQERTIDLKEMGSESVISKQRIYRPDGK